jgi:cytochrome c oxidase assembly protein subunit 11
LKSRVNNSVLAVTLLGIAVGMVGMAFAAVPLYRLFCQMTGYAGTTQRADAGADRTLEREVVVRFDANVSGLSWSFAPEIPQMRVKLGETAMVNFVAQNTGSKPTVGHGDFQRRAGHHRGLLQQNRVFLLH